MNVLTRAARRFAKAPLIIRLLLGILAIQLLAYAGAVAAEAVPDSPIANNLVDAIASRNLTTVNHGRTPSGRRLDHYTECIAITEGLGDPRGSTPFETAASNPDLDKCSIAVPKLSRWAETGEWDRPVSYFRYWHGYALITRPSLAIFGLGATRTLCLFLILGSLGGFWAMARRRFGPWVAGALTLPAIMTADVLEVHGSIPHAISWAFAFLCSMLALALLNPGGSRLRVSPAQCLLVGVVIGSLVAYFDLMIAMAANLCLFLTLTLLLVQQHQGAAVRWGKAILAVSASGAGWVLGLATTWASKWVVAAAFLGYDAVAENIERQVGFRISGSSEIPSGGFGYAVRKNLRVWIESRMVLLLLIVTIVALAVWTIRAWRRGSFRPMTLLMYAGISLSVPVWFEALSSHSQIHAWLIYRSLAIALSTIIVGVIQSTRAVRLAPTTVVAAE